MDADSLSKLLALCATAAVALGSGWLLTRYDRRPRPPPALREGYPARDFPRRELVESGPLASLWQIQARLLGLYQRLPASSDAKASLLIFLGELRALMDGAYELACGEEGRAGTTRWASFVLATQQAADAMAEQVQRHSTAGSDEGLSSELERRLEVLRVLSRDLEEL